MKKTPFQFSLSEKPLPSLEERLESFFISVLGFSNSNFFRVLELRLLVAELVFLF